ncbi:ABC transporter [Sphingobium algorifonticola]|uniref:ABC transporter n=2 Tax=Sphingobium algorifonticola TaxID=2008318 RepID=A0A437JDU6_9SPHN|nr:ABC transporter [Sphingobium algorifonticola]
MKGAEMMRNSSRILAGMLLCTALAGCVSFGDKAPTQLLSLSSDARVAPGTTRIGGSGKSITVLPPETPKQLDTVRVPVQVDAVSVAYVKDARWVDSPRQMFQHLLSETIAASGSAIVLDPGQYSADPGRRLLGVLVDFGIDARTNSAIVTYDATLAPVGGQPVQRKRFSASVPVGTIDATGVGNPINQAANKVAAEVAAWVGTTG